MIRRFAAVCGTVAGGGLLGAGCMEAVETADGEPAEGVSLVEAVSARDIEDAREIIMRERLEEARAAGSARGEACRASCAVSYAAASLAVQHACLGAEVITIGGATIPCATAIAAVCLSSAALASVCAGTCPP